jgi:hypothetical protein
LRASVSVFPNITDATSENRCRIQSIWKRRKTMTFLNPRPPGINFITPNQTFRNR